MVSSLAEEVAALDRARAASSAGSFQAAARLIDDYHRQFPDGALGADAEVIALDALSASHDRAAVTARAARFLAQHPNDPHAGHVRKLAASQD